MDLENADLRMMRVMEAYQVKEFHPDVCKDPEIADLRMSERWRSIRECSSLLSIVKHVLQDYSVVLCWFTVPQTILKRTDEERKVYSIVEDFELQFKEKEDC